MQEARNQIAAIAAECCGLHRWIGFVQAGILTNRILDLDAIKAMFDEVKRSTAAIAEDVDLIDHLDVEHTFSLDIGGQG
jgi:hypothetical protein